LAKSLKKLVGTTGIEPVTPTMSTQRVDGNYRQNRSRSAGKYRIRSRLDHAILGHCLGVLGGRW
jgi:hypothetical protein